MVVTAQNLQKIEPKIKKIHEHLFIYFISQKKKLILTNQLPRT